MKIFEWFKTRKMLINRVCQLQNRVSQLQKENFELEKRDRYLGVFYVYNPKKDKPRRIYYDYYEALRDCERVCKKEHSKMYVLNIVSVVEPAIGTPTVNSHWESSEFWDIPF